MDTGIPGGELRLKAEDDDGIFVVHDRGGRMGASRTCRRDVVPAGAEEMTTPSSEGLRTLIAQCEDLFDAMDQQSRGVEISAPHERLCIQTFVPRDVVFGRLILIRASLRQLEALLSTVERREVQGVTVELADLREGEENDGPLESNDLWIQGRGLSVLVNVPVGSEASFAVTVDGKAVQHGAIGKRQPEPSGSPVIRSSGEDEKARILALTNVIDAAAVTLAGSFPSRTTLDVRQRLHTALFDLRDMALGLPAPPSPAPEPKTLTAEEDMGRCRYCSKWGPCSEHAAKYLSPAPEKP